MADVVDVVAQVSGMHRRRVAAVRRQLVRPGRLDQGLRRREESRQARDPRQRSDLVVGQDGALTQNAEKADYVQLDVGQAALYPREILTHGSTRSEDGDVRIYQGHEGRPRVAEERPNAITLTEKKRSNIPR
jgi:hypothetical protein